MIVAEIDRDYLYDPRDGIGSRFKYHWTDRVAIGWPDQDVINGKRIRFRLKDDDGLVYYGGWLLNDYECTMQQILLEWAMHDAGCAIIEVCIDGQWKQEIG